MTYLDPTDNWPLMLNAFTPAICAAQARLARWLLSRLAVLEKPRESAQKLITMRNQTP